MVFSHISNPKFSLNGAGMLVVCIANPRHVEITIETLILGKLVSLNLSQLSMYSYG